MTTNISDAITFSQREIVVGLDDGAAAAAALRWAAEQAGLTGRWLRVVHAWQPSTFEQATGSSEYLAAAIADARARATRWVRDALGTTASDVRWSLDIVDGAPGPALVERSRDAHLLVLGTREHTGLRRTVLGSVSHYCLSHAVAPVVAVPRPKQESPRKQEASSGMLNMPGPLL